MRLANPLFRNLLGARVLVLVALLASCGGGGISGGVAPPANAAGSWDTLVWDQGSWQ